MGREKVISIHGKDHDIVTQQAGRTNVSPVAVGREMFINPGTASTIFAVYFKTSVEALFLELGTAWTITIRNRLGCRFSIMIVCNHT